MRIAIVSLHTSPLETPGQRDAGGMNVVVIEQARALAALGHEVHVFTRFSGAGQVGSVFLGGGSAIVHTISAGDASLRKEDLPAITSEFGEKLHAFGNFDIVHSHYWLSALAAEDWARKTGTPHAVTFHTVASQKNSRFTAGGTATGGDVADSGDAKVGIASAGGMSLESQFRVQEEERLAQSANVIAISQNELSAALGSDAERVTRAFVINPGVDTEFFSPAKSPRLNQLLVLGRLQPLKGVELAIDTFAVLQEMFKSGQETPRLIIAGDTTPGAENYKHELITRAANRGLTVSDSGNNPRDCNSTNGRYTQREGVGTGDNSTADVDFIGTTSRSRAARELAASKLLLQPSLSETFGLVALEAAASATPVIAAFGSGLETSVRHGESGLLIQRDAKCWAIAIHDLLTNEEKLAALSRGALKHARAYGWAAHAKELERAYKTIIEREA